MPPAAMRMTGVPDVSRLPCDRLLDSGGAEYMRRYYLSHGRGPQTRFHQILADDPDRYWHDHPWDYTTRLLSGAGYIEHTPSGAVSYRPGDVLVRKAGQLHRLELIDGPVWTYFVTGRWKRAWGFMTERGWIDHRAMRSGTVAGCERMTGGNGDGRHPEPSSRAW